MPQLTPRDLLAYTLVRDHGFDLEDARSAAIQVNAADSAFHRVLCLSWKFGTNNAELFRMAKATAILRACGYLPPVTL